VKRWDSYDVIEPPTYHFEILKYIDDMSGRRWDYNHGGPEEGDSRQLVLWAYLPSPDVIIGELISPYTQQQET
jgi:hypothetical protein